MKKTRKKVRYKEVKAGKWEQPIERGYRLVCCDCRLVHWFDFRIHNGKVQMRAWRRERETAAIRKQEGIIMKIGKRRPGQREGGKAE